MSIVVADHVSKWYGQVIGLNDVTLTVPAGKVSVPDTLVKSVPAVAGRLPSRPT